MEKMIFQSALTVIVPVKPDSLAALKNLLNDVGNNIAKHPEVDFSRSGTIHYCRFFLIDQAFTPDRVDLPPMLCFNTNFDGDVNQHIADWYRFNRAFIDKVFGCCAGYTAGCSEAELRRYCLANRHKEKLFWPAKRGWSVDLIRREHFLKQEIEKFLDAWRLQENVGLLSREAVYSKIKAFVGSRADLKWGLNPSPKPTLGYSLLYNLEKYFLYAFIIACLIGLLPLVLTWVALAKHFENQDNKHPGQPVRKDTDDVVDCEDRVWQNQLTIYGTLKKPSWFRVNNMRLFLALSSFSGKFRATKGNLGGIETIHFVSWVSFNKGRNVMFLSNYDGGWESYLSEFIDRAASIMNLSFGNMIGYPKIHNFLGGGAHDEQAFKAIVRDNQYPCPIWYSAYPYITIKNVLNNAEVRKGLSQNLSGEDLRQWLNRI